MKTKLLRKIRSINVIYKRNNEYKYICHIKSDGGNWFVETDWTTDKQSLIEERRLQIIKQASEQWKPAKSVC